MVKVLGLNATVTESDLNGKKIRHAISVALLSQMSRYMENDDDILQNSFSYTFPQKYIEIIEPALRKLERIYKKVEKESGEANFNLNKIEINEGKAVVKKGMAWHNIPVGEDSSEVLLERLESISKNGLLASEWFGLKYDNNEVPHCVSFHKVFRDTTIENLKSWTGKEDKVDKFPNLQQEISFFIDYENPLLKPLVDVVPAQVRIKTEKELDNLENSDIIRALSKETIYQHIVEENLRKYAKNQALQDYENRIKVIPGNPFPTLSPETFEKRLFDLYKEYGSKEGFLEERERYYLRQILEPPTGPLKYYGFVACGVPPAFINGIALPKALASDEALVKNMQNLFPNIRIFDKEGQLINKTQSCEAEMN